MSFFLLFIDGIQNPDLDPPNYFDCGSIIRLHLTFYNKTSEFWPPVRARALREPVFFAFIATLKGALRAPPPPIKASLLLIRPPKIVPIYRTWAANVKGFFLSTGPQRL
jgi:hypothetical protein